MSKIMNFADGPSEIKIGQEVVYSNGQSRQHYRLNKTTVKSVGNKKSEAHHADYSKPLDVVWLCDWHHKEEHKRLKELV